MDLAQILDSEALQVTLSSLNTRMTQNSGKIKKVPARPQVAHRKGVAKGVGREADAGNDQLFSESLEIPFKVPNGDFCVVLCTKDEIWARWPIHANAIRITPQELSEFKREWNQPMFPALTFYPQRQVVEVYFFFRQSKNLTRPKPAIKNRKRHQVRPASAGRLAERELQDTFNVAAGKGS